MSGNVDAGHPADVLKPRLLVHPWHDISGAVRHFEVSFDHCLHDRY